MKDRYLYVVASVVAIYSDGVSVLTRTFEDALNALEYYDAVKKRYITTTLETDDGYVLLRYPGKTTQRH